MLRTFSYLFALTCLALPQFTGCSKSESTPAVESTSSHTDSGHSHDGWWCNEHGVPEEVCARCDTKQVAQFKAKGDWCDKHDRPDSQCFVCHPEHEAKFAAQYEAKYGQQPPKPTEDGHDHGAEEDHSPDKS